MKFKAVSYTVGQEVSTSETEYYNILTVEVEVVGTQIPNFSRDIYIYCTQDMNGYEVDSKRQEAIENLINNI